MLASTSQCVNQYFIEMDAMDKTIFGYYIEPDVYFNIDKRMLVNVDKNIRFHRYSPVILRETMFHLLVYLLENAKGNIISNSDILLNVWDNHGLSSSNQRLWQVMNALKMKLNSVGVTEDFIMRVESKGYYVRENLVSILYTNKKSGVAGKRRNAEQVIS